MNHPASTLSATGHTSAFCCLPGEVTYLTQLSQWPVTIYLFMLAGNILTGVGVGFQCWTIQVWSIFNIHNYAMSTFVRLKIISLL